jgi:hypothetical protein
MPNHGTCTHGLVLTVALIHDANFCFGVHQGGTPAQWQTRVLKCRLLEMVRVTLSHEACDSVTRAMQCCKTVEKWQDALQGDFPYTAGA